MLERLYHYVEDKEFRFTIYEDKIHIINYTRIITIDRDRISIKSKNKKIILKGNNFILSKLLENEILILGTITNIEVENES